MKKIIIPVIILVLLIVGTWFWWNNRSTDEPTEDTTIEESFVQEEPTPTDAPDFEKSDFKIRVLNGSGTAGLAGDLEEELLTNDYVVEDTGNADRYDYDETIIQYKEDVPEEFIDELRSDISSYSPFSTEELDADEDVDIVIIIGGQQSEDEESTSDDESTKKADPTPDAEASDEADTQ